MIFTFTQDDAQKSKVKGPRSAVQGSWKGQWEPERLAAMYEICDAESKLIKYQTNSSAKTIKCRASASTR